LAAQPGPRVRAGRRSQSDVDAARRRQGRPPSVPDGVSRLRITAGAGVTAEEWERAAKAIDTIVGEVR
ncbi:8-amino-7-oxononanoate synthase, partial [Nocardioides sp. NPDC000441]